MGLYKTYGIVLGHRDLGEADKILTIFSPNHGKLHAVAKGVRRPRNRLIGGTQLFSFSDFLIMKGRNLDVISQCELKESFHEIRSNLERMAYGSFFAEMIRATTPIEEKNSELFRFFLKTLYVLTNWTCYETLSRIFEIKLMAIQGFTPQISQCAACGSKLTDEMKFSPALGGVICKKCFDKDREAVIIDKNTLYTMHIMLKKTYEALANLNISCKINTQLKKSLHLFIQNQLDYKFKTLKFIEDINKLKVKEK